MGIYDFDSAEGGGMEPIRVALGSWFVGKDAKLL
jgi:hypothetical protein